ncbi:hypothetical protein C8J55DRAFT_305921 [Lentinula edodes]|uniref:Uncharacterized protein n=1 Tax=Lentinula lateritia TaxID=40482 RepID=A0A9W9AVN6_9AGAR|nr:hypothetical protein C8J55DRAFT_305921 [Lentinula edodes]
MVTRGHCRCNFLKILLFTQNRLHSQELSHQKCSTSRGHAFSGYGSVPSGQLSPCVLYPMKPNVVPSPSRSSGLCI